MQKQPLWTRNFWGMCLGSFFQYMTHYALLASLPIFVIDILKHSDNQAGLVMTFFQIGAVIFRPFAGKWIDELQKKKILFTSLTAFLLVTFLYFGSRSLTLLLLLRFLHGAVFSVGTTATATLAAIISPDSRKGEGIGYFSMFTSLAMVIGPFLGLLVITYYNFNILFAVCVILAMLSLACSTMLRLPPSLLTSVKLKQNQPFRWTSLVEMNALPIALTGGLLSFVYAGILTYIPIYAKSLGMIEYASAFFAVYAIMIVLSRPFVSHLFDHRGVNTVIYPAIFLFAIGMIGLSQVQGALGLLSAGAVIGLGFGALNPSFQTIAILSAPDNRSGVATSTYFLLFDLGLALGSFILGSIVFYTDYRTMYLISAIVILLMAVIYYLVGSKKLNSPN